MMQHILAVGADPSLLYSRGLVLARSGAPVRTAAAEPGLLLLENSEFSVVVLCHSLQERDTLRLCAQARAFAPSAKILLLEAPGYPWQATLSVDARFMLEDGPELLVRTVRSLLGAAPVAAEDDPDATPCVLPFPSAKQQTVHKEPVLYPLTGRPQPRMLRLARTGGEAEK